MTAALIILFGGIAALVVACVVLVGTYVYQHVNYPPDMRRDIEGPKVDTAYLDYLSDQWTGEKKR